MKHLTEKSDSLKLFQKLNEGTNQKRISKYREFDNGHILHNWYEMTDEEAEEKAKQASIKDPTDIYYVQYDDVMNPCSDIRWYQGNQYSIEQAQEIRKKNNEANYEKMKMKKEVSNESSLKESYEVWQRYFEDGGITTEYVQSFDTYEQAQKFADGLNRDPDCEAWVKDINESENISAKLKEDSLDSEDIPTYKEAIKSYNKTDYGYHNNVTTVYGELLDGNWFVHIPENDVINIYDTAITNKFIDTLYNYDDIDAEDDVRDDEWYDNFQKEHNITDRYDKDKLGNLEIELNARYYDMPAKLKEDSLNPGEIQLYMNTWGNYNEHGADVENINGGWMDIDQAKEFLEAHKDEEPFINDTENVPGDLDIDEYTNPWEAIEELEYIENSDDKEALIAIIESIGKFDEAKEVYESGDYTFFSGVEDDEELGRAYVDMVGGLEGVANIGNYIDEEAYKESWREAAEQSVREENPDLDEDSDEFEDEVENWLNGVASEQLEIDKADGADLSDYFDYEALGRDLDFEGYFFASTGAVQTN